MGRGRTCGARVAGEGPDEDFETWRGAAATAGRPPSRRQEGETESGVKCAHWVGGREEGRQGQERDTTGRPGWVPCLRVRLEGGPELGPFCHRLRASIGFHNQGCTVPLQLYCLVIWFFKKRVVYDF